MSNQSPVKIKLLPGLQSMLWNSKKSGLSCVSVFVGFCYLFRSYNTRENVCLNQPPKSYFAVFSPTKIQLCCLVPKSLLSFKKMVKLCPVLLVPKWVLCQFNAKKWRSLLVPKMVWVCYVCSFVQFNGCLELIISLENWISKCSKRILWNHSINQFKNPTKSIHRKSTHQVEQSFKSKMPSVVASKSSSHISHHRNSSIYHSSCIQVHQYIIHHAYKFINTSFIMHTSSSVHRSSCIQVQQYIIHHAYKFTIHHSSTRFIHHAYKFINTSLINTIHQPTAYHTISQSIEQWSWHG